MKRSTYEEAKRTSQEIAKLLKDENLTPAERQKFERLLAELAGVLLRPWFPVDWGRRSIMAAIFLAGFYWLVEGNQHLSFVWLLLPIFSPRFAGEASHALSKFFGGSR